MTQKIFLLYESFPREYDRAYDRAYRYHGRIDVLEYIYIYMLDNGDRNTNRGVKIRERLHATARVLAHDSAGSLDETLHTVRANGGNVTIRSTKTPPHD